MTVPGGGPCSPPGTQRTATRPPGALHVCSDRASPRSEQLAGTACSGRWNSRPGPLSWENTSLWSCDPGRVVPDGRRRRPVLTLTIAAFAGGQPRHRAGARPAARLPHLLAGPGVASWRTGPASSACRAAPARSKPPALHRTQWPSRSARWLAWECHSHCEYRWRAQPTRARAGTTLKGRNRTTRILGYATAITLALGGTALVALTVKALPDVRRYLKMRSI
jgi:hypothetical protein